MPLFVQKAFESSIGDKTALTRSSLAAKMPAIIGIFGLQTGEAVKFQLSKAESDNLKSQTVTSSWGGVCKMPLAFTEQGVAMARPFRAAKKPGLCF